VRGHGHVTPGLRGEGEVEADGLKLVVDMVKCPHRAVPHACNGVLVGRHRPPDHPSLVDAPIDQRHQEFVLDRDVVLEQGLRGYRRLSHIVDRRGVAALRQEEIQGKHAA